MKRFRFPLQRVLEFRRQQEEIEAARLQALKLERRRLEDRARILENESRAARSVGSAGARLDGLSVRRSYDLAAALSREREQTLTQAEIVERRRLRQMAAAIEAQRAVRLLERLRERKAARHWRETWRELEILAGELHLAKRQREKSSAGVLLNR